MASPPIHTPTGTTGFNFEAWEKRFRPASYQRKKFIPTIDRSSERLYNLLHIRKERRMAGSVLAQSAEGTGLTYSQMDDTPVTVSPAGNYVAIAYSENFRAQLDQDLGRRAPALEQALAETSEASAMTAIQSLTNIISQADVDASMLRRAVARVATNSNGLGMPGDPGSPTIHGIFTTKQLPNLNAIPEVNAADVRGDSENPYVKGVWSKGFGILLMVTTVLPLDANGDHNCVYLSDAFVISWNEENMVERSKVEGQYRVWAYNNFGSGVLFNQRAVACRTTASAL